MALGNSVTQYMELTGEKIPLRTQSATAQQHSRVYFVIAQSADWPFRKSLFEDDVC
jgi:hypothetical protein